MAMDPLLIIMPAYTLRHVLDYQLFCYQDFQFNYIWRDCEPFYLFPFSLLSMS